MTKQRPRRSSGPSFVSLYSGCGGLDLGFSRAGFSCAGSFDWDKQALAVHAANLDGRTCAWDLSTGALPADFGSGEDVLLAGSPCQGFSTIGKRELDDKRNDLLLSAGRIALSRKPRIFIAENVPAVEYGQHSKYWNCLQNMLSSGGYSCQTIKLDASDYGVAQMRRRVFLVAVRGIHDFAIRTHHQSPLTVDEALNGLGEGTTTANHAPELLPKFSKDYQISRRIGAGQKLCNVRVSERAVPTWLIPEVFGQTTIRERAVLNAVLRIRRRERRRENGDADPVKLKSIEANIGTNPSIEVTTLLRKNYLRKVGPYLDLKHTFNGKYRRLDPNGLSLTVDTAFGSPRNFLHPHFHRGLTVREAARIQGFPDSFEFAGTVAEQYRFVGNAVPPPMARALATEVRRILERLPHA